MEEGGSMFVRSPYNYDMLKASNESALACTDESLAVQSERDECDINTIVARFGLTGKMPSDLRAPTYEDYSGVGDFKSSVDAVRTASETFMELPADVRFRFRNDPQEFLTFASDEKNFDELAKLGLVLPEAVQRRQAAVEAAREAEAAKAAGAAAPAAP